MALKLDRCLGSIAAMAPVKFQSDTIIETLWLCILVVRCLMILWVEGLSVLCNERNITVYTECQSSGHLLGGDGMFNQSIIS